ncbi:MAG: DUF1501 domain-containing protein, partial [Planctomycetaceae bacterium]|nr:DUF1501 domain-containing protein [Planctomycetaceae bacterium]
RETIPNRPHRFRFSNHILDQPSRKSRDSNSNRLQYETGETRLKPGVAKGSTSSLALAGFKPRRVLGTLDEFGRFATEDLVTYNNQHATIRECTVFDHQRLTYHFSGRGFCLTNVLGRIVGRLLSEAGIPDPSNPFR